MSETDEPVVDGSADLAPDATAEQVAESVAPPVTETEIVSVEDVPKGAVEYDANPKYTGDLESSPGVVETIDDPRPTPPQ